MSFELWLYTVKKIAQTMAMTMTIFDSLPESTKNKLSNEYKEYIKNTNKK